MPQYLVAKHLKEAEEMQRRVVIEPSHSEWCSSVVIMVKKDGSLHICMDCRRLYSMLEVDAYLIPWLDELLERISRARFIATLDLCKGNWQVPLEAGSLPRMVFQTPAGLFQITMTSSASMVHLLPSSG